MKCELFFIMSLDFDNRRSFGNDSITTVSSSIADEYLYQNLKLASKQQNIIEENLKSNLKNLMNDEKKPIQVGDIIYNFYTPPTSEIQHQSSMFVRKFVC